MRAPERIDICLIVASTCIITSALMSCTPRRDGPPTSSGSARSVSPADTARPTTDVNALLPLPRADLTAAVRLVTRFAATYATYRYDEDPQDYLARLRPDTTPEMYAALTRSAATPGTRSERTREHETATAQAGPVKLRVVASDSLILILDVRQVVTTGTDTRQSTQRLAVTAVKTNDGDWAISDIEPATAGDQGDTSGAGTN